MVNALLVGNTARQGGAIYASYGGLTEFQQITIVGNKASYLGGALYTSDNNDLSAFKNSILWNNTAPNGNGTTARLSHSFGNSLIQGSGGSANWNANYGTNAGGNIDADPHFYRNPTSGDGNWATLSDNDYGNLMLQSDSPATDAGDNTLVFTDFADIDKDGNTTELLPRDLGGNFRFVDLPAHADTGSGTAPIIDMGAYETPAFNYTHFVYLPLTLKKSF
jgi:predicted outer membrane repeat protein